MIWFLLKLGLWLFAFHYLAAIVIVVMDTWKHVDQYAIDSEYNRACAEAEKYAGLDWALAKLRHVEVNEWSGIAHDVKMILDDPSSPVFESSTHSVEATATWTT